MRRFLFALALLVGVSPALAQRSLLLGAGGVLTTAGAPPLTISCAGTGSTSSTIACTLTYTGTAPVSATGAWNTTCSGPSTITSFTASAGTGSFTASTPSGACAGTLTITTNIPTSATSGSVTISGGGANFAAISTGHSFLQVSSGTAGPNMTTTGAKLYVVTISTNGSFNTFVDNASNTYTCSTAAGSIGAVQTEICWKLNPTVSTPENITWFPAGGANGTLTFQAYTDTGSGPTLDLQNNSGTGGSSSPASSGSITPTGANALVVTTFVAQSTSSSTITNPSGYTATDVPTCTSGFQCGGQAYLIQTSATATNPAWGVTNLNGTLAGAVVVDFKP